jgi:hypothetical protein
MVTMMSIPKVNEIVVIISRFRPEESFIATVTKRLPTKRYIELINSIPTLSITFFKELANPIAYTGAPEAKRCQKPLSLIHP